MKIEFKSRNIPFEHIILPDDINTTSQPPKFKFKINKKHPDARSYEQRFFPLFSADTSEEDQNTKAGSLTDDRYSEADNNAKNNTATIKFIDKLLQDIDQRVDSDAYTKLMEFKNKLLSKTNENAEAVPISPNKQEKEDEDEENIIDTKTLAQMRKREKKEKKEKKLREQAEKNLLKQKESELKKLKKNFRTLGEKLNLYTTIIDVTIFLKRIIELSGLKDYNARYNSDVKYEFSKEQLEKLKIIKNMVKLDLVVGLSATEKQKLVETINELEKNAIVLGTNSSDESLNKFIRVIATKVILDPLEQKTEKLPEKQNLEGDYKTALNELRIEISKEIPRSQRILHPQIIRAIREGKNNHSEEMQTFRYCKQRSQNTVDLIETVNSKHVTREQKQTAIHNYKENMDAIPTTTTMKQKVVEVITFALGIVGGAVAGFFAAGPIGGVVGGVLGGFAAQGSYNGILSRLKPVNKKVDAVANRAQQMYQNTPLHNKINLAKKDFKLACQLFTTSLSEIKEGLKQPNHSRFSIAKDLGEVIKIHWQKLQQNSEIASIVNKIWLKHIDVAREIPFQYRASYAQGNITSNSDHIIQYMHSILINSQIDANQTLKGFIYTKQFTILDQYKEKDEDCSFIETFRAALAKDTRESFISRINRSERSEDYTEFYFSRMLPRAEKGNLLAIEDLLCINTMRRQLHEEQPKLMLEIVNKNKTSIEKFESIKMFFDKLNILRTCVDEQIQKNPGYKELLHLKDTLNKELSVDNIETVYRKLSLKYHTDQTQSVDSKYKQADINTAHAYLTENLRDPSFTALINALRPPSLVDDMEETTEEARREGLGSSFGT